jgi:hypothetical protein
MFSTVFEDDSNPKRAGSIGAAALVERIMASDARGLTY